MNSGDWYWFKIRVVGNTVWGKVWPASETAEPGWMTKNVFTSGLENKAIGLFSYDARAVFDDVKVMTIEFLVDEDFGSTSLTTPAGFTVLNGNWQATNSE
jgi:hypothetical protein